MANGVLQQTGQWVSDQLLKLQNEVEARRVEITINNGNIVAANARANAISDPVVRKNVQDGLHHLAERQAVIVSAWRTFGAKASDIADSWRKWLAANGYTNGLNGLGELGAIPVIPIVIIAALTAGSIYWISNAWIAVANINAQRPAIDAQARAADAYVAHQLTDAQYAAVTKNLKQSADSAMPKGDPLGLANLSAALPMIAIVAALVIFGPTLARSLGRRTQGAH